jgi:hypothetical protein
MVNARKLLSWPTALFHGRGFYFSISQLCEMRVDLFALGKKNGDGLFLKLLCFFNRGHNPPRSRYREKTLVS